MVESYTRCCRIMTIGDWGRKRQCSRKGVVMHNGKMYCKQHDPKRIEQKKLKQQQKFDSQTMLDKRKHILLSMAVNIDTKDLDNYELTKIRNKNEETKSS